MPQGSLIDLILLYISSGITASKISPSATYFITSGDRILSSGIFRKFEIASYCWLIQPEVAVLGTNTCSKCSSNIIPLHTTSDRCPNNITYDAKESYLERIKVKNLKMAVTHHWTPIKTQRWRHLMCFTYIHMRISYIYRV